MASQLKTRVCRNCVLSLSVSLRAQVSVLLFIYSQHLPFYRFISMACSLPADINLVCCRTNSWLARNVIRLNQSNFREDILIDTEEHRSPHTIHIHPQFQNIFSNLGVILDSTLSLKAYINNIKKQLFFYLKNLTRLRPSLTDPYTCFHYKTGLLQDCDCCASFQQHKVCTECSYSH